MLLEVFLTFKNEARNSRVLIYQYVTFVEITLDIYSPLLRSCGPLLQ